MTDSSSVTLFIIYSWVYLFFCKYS